jgi:hypothetical protein
MASPAVARAVVKQKCLCPHCASAHVHRSHRRGPFEHLLSALGADVRRCHDCRRRWASWERRSMRLGERDRSPQWQGWLAISCAAVLLIAMVLILLNRFGELRG